MVCSVHAFVDPAGKLRELPNYVGRSWQTKVPVITLCRKGNCWLYGEYVDMGVTLNFAGWSGLDRSEPLASFTSKELPGLIVFLPPSKLEQWCRELLVEETGEPVKVRIADECESGEGE